MPSFQDRARVWLEEVRSLVSDRAERETTLARRTRDESARISREHSEVSFTAESRWEEVRTRNTRECEERTAQARQAFESDRVAIIRRRDAEVAAFDERTASLEQASARRLQESLWLADTMSESGSLKARQEFDRAKRELDARAARLATQTQEVEGLVQRHRAASDALRHGLASSASSESAEALPPLSDAIEQLRRAIRPPILRPAVLVVPLLALLAMGTWIGVRWAEDPEWARRASLWTGLAAALFVLAGAAVWFRARRKVPAAGGMVGERLAASRRDLDAALDSLTQARERRLDEIRQRRERDHERSRDKHAATLDEVRVRREQRGPSLRARHDEKLDALEARFNETVRRLEEGRDQRLAAGLAERDSTLAEATSRRDAQRHDSEARSAQDFDALRSWWKDSRLRLHDEAEAMAGLVASFCPPWSDEHWRTFHGALGHPPGVPLGSFRIDLAALPGGLPDDQRLALDLPNVYNLPALVDVTGKGSLLVVAGPDARTHALDVLRGSMLRLVAAFPPGKVRFTILDPVGLGESFAAFMHLADHDGSLVGERIWTEPRHIEQRLGDLTEHTENVIQKYLRNQFATIQDYNEAAGEVAEPYRFLVIADFPANISEAAGKRLASIASSGPRCGVFTLIACDPRLRPGPAIPMDELERTSIVLRRRHDRFEWSGEPFASHTLVIDPPPPESAQTRLLQEVGRLSQDASRVRVPYELLEPAALGQGDASREIRIPLGRAGALKLQHLVLGRGTAQHALVAGRTGSGKSTLLHVLITTLALHYSPDEVELYLVDFKKGVEFKVYATLALPHARVVAVESEREFGLSVLRRLDAELSSRGSLFRERGVQDLAAFRSVAGPLPRVVLIVDEFQEFFVEDDKLAQEASLLLDRLVRQGRAFGMHVVLGSQTLSGAYSLARSTMGQMGVRIALQCSEADAFLIMSEDNSAPRLLSRPGEAIYNDASGLVEGNSPFQVAWLDDPARELALQRVRQAMPAPRVPPLVFEGNRPADLAENHAFASALRAEPVPAAPGIAWLGEPISIKPPTHVSFQPQGGSNLLIVGQDEPLAAGMVLASLLSLQATVHPEIVLLDAQDRASSLATPVDRLGGRVIGSRHLAQTLRELAAELQRRESEPAASPTFVVVFGVQRLRDFRRSDDFSIEAAGSPPDQLAALLREGPARSMHVILWSDTLIALERAVDRRTLREFAPRVLLQMSGADSTALIDSPAAGSLGRHRAILAHDDLGTSEKFRPYSLPDPIWLNSTLDVLSARIPNRS